MLFPTPGHVRLLLLLGLEGGAVVGELLEGLPADVRGAHEPLPDLRDRTHPAMVVVNTGGCGDKGG